MDYATLITENVNPDTVDIDLCDTKDILHMIHREDCKVAPAVGQILPDIAKAVDIIFARMQCGGRLIYAGAGTSGRLGILDASECPPTFGTEPGQVMGIIAGGDRALRASIEGAEDCYQLGVSDTEQLKVTEKDTVVGISASGNARYVLGVIEHASHLGAATIAVCNATPGAVLEAAEVAIVPVVGPEVIMGSTRMKAGSAQKMVLNMLSTAVMIKLGKVYRNLMVDLSPSNNKLRDRTVRIIMQAVDVSRGEAERALESCDGHPKLAIVLLLCGCSAETAAALLKHEPNVRKAVQTFYREYPLK